MMDPAIALFDDDVAPDDKLRAVAACLTRMMRAGELAGSPEDTQRLIAIMPMLLLDIAGDVFALRRRPVGRVLHLHPAMVVIEGGKQ